VIQLTADELRSLIVTASPVSVCTCKSHSFEIGKAYLIRTVTMHYTGRVIAITDSDVLLEDAAWIADTGRFADSLQTGELSEIEPYPGRVAVCRGAMVDFCEWTHRLPKVQK
jgi:hypothetical protein